MPPTLHRRRFLVAAAALPVALGLWRVGRNRFTILNDSGQRIVTLTVTVCGRNFMFADIPSGERRTARFGTPSDEDTFHVTGTLGDGTVIADYCGYVAWEDHGRHFRLVVRPDGGASCAPA